MNVSEIQPGMMGIRVKGTIKTIGEIREVQTKFGNRTTVANAILSDDSGEVKFTLWGDQIQKVKIGDDVEVVNGMAKEWQGEIQISVGKRGELNVLQK